MKSEYVSRKWSVVALAALLGAGLPVLAQQREDQPSPDGWRRFDEPRDRASVRPAPVEPPSQLILPAGAWIAIRVDQPLSSDRNHPGDLFTATLAQPVIADGFVVARRGQTVTGRVAEAVKAGRVKGTSQLALDLTEMTMVDGQQIPIETRLMEYNGGSTYGRDATAIGTTTAAGAAIGAAANGGFGAGVGAAAGAAASAIGVLLTRGRATEVYPEAVLTFRTVAPLTIQADRARHAFQAVGQQDYEPRPLQRRAPPTLMPPPYYYSSYYGPYSPYFYGPGFYGPGFYYYSRPYYRGGFRRR